jgi:hypothetical protein
LVAATARQPSFLVVLGGGNAKKLKEFPDGSAGLTEPGCFMIVSKKRRLAAS